MNTEARPDPVTKVPEAGGARDLLWPGRAGRPPARAGRIVDALSLWIQILVLLALALVVLVSVIARYVFDRSLLFENALIQLLFIWCIFVGLGRATWRGQLLHLSMWTRRGPMLRNWVDGLGDGVTLAVLGLLMYSTISAIPADVSTGIPLLPVSVVWESAAIGVGSLLGAAGVILRILDSNIAISRLGATLIFAIASWSVVAVGAITGAWTLALLVVLVLLDVPIMAAIALCASALVAGGGLSESVSIFVNQEINSVQDVAFIALPLFMLLGGLVAQTGLAEDLGRFLKAALGWLPGGVGVSCVAAAGVLANMTGSPIADTATLGGVFIPALIRDGYTKAEAAALQACAGLLGLVFPPAIVLIIWATVVNVSVTAQFAAILVPGGMLMATMMVVVVIRGIVKRPPAAGGSARARTSWGHELGSSALGASPVLAIPAILDAGIFTGAFAAYEAGAVALCIAGGIGAARKRVRRQHLALVGTQAADTTVLVMAILGSVGILQYGMFTSGVDQAIGAALGFVAGSPILFWLVVNIAFMILHEFVEPIPAILLLSPFIVPLAATVHVSLIQLGAVIVVNSTIGLVLPPLGVNLYVASDLAKARSTEVLQKVWPYLLGSVIVLGLVSAAPVLTSL